MKVNFILRLEFELVCFGNAVQNFSNNVKWTPVDVLAYVDHFLVNIFYCFWEKNIVNDIYLDMIIISAVWFGSFVLWHINLYGLFNVKAKAILVKEKQWYYSTHCWVHLLVHKNVKLDSNTITAEDYYKIYLQNNYQINHNRLLKI